MRERLRSMALMFRLGWRADRLLAVGTAGATLVEGGTRVMFAFWTKVLVDGAVTQNLRSIVVAAAGQGITTAMLGLLNMARIGWGTKLAEKASFEIEQTIISLAASVPTIEHYERPEYLDRVSMLTTQKGFLGSIVGVTMSTMMTIVQLVGNLILVFTIHPLMLLLPAFALPSALLSRRIVAIQERAREATAPQMRLGTHAFEMATEAGPAKEIRLFGLGQTLLDLYETRSRAAETTFVRAFRRVALLSGIGWTIFALGYGGALVLVVWQAVTNPANVTVGDVVLAFTVAGMLNGLIGQLLTIGRWFGETLVAVGRIVWLQDFARDARGRRAEPPPARIDRAIRFESVGFTYPGTEEPVLRDVTLEIPAASVVALVGENGAGKTTLVKLITRMYEPTAGHIRVDGADLGDVDPIAWRERTSAGFQDFARFEFLARENVGVGDVPLVEDEAAIRAALERAHAGGVVETLPDGLATQLGKSFTDGAELSIGQWQQLALGRAMMRELPLLLVLDEPTASLDADAEHALFEQYAGAGRRIAAANGGVTLLVSHRFSTVLMADLIVVMDGGRVVDAGSHAELMSRGGLYAELFSIQARAYR